MIKGTFLADFSSFSDAVAKAEVQLKGFEQSGSKVTTSLTRMSNALSGTRLIQDATVMAKAVENVGGVSKLTASEVQRLGAQAKEAVEKMRALGVGVPANLQAIANAAKPVQSELSSLIGVAGKVAGAFGIAFSVGAVVNFGKSLLKTAGDIADLSAATGVSKQALQQFAYVGVGVGVSMDEIGRAVGTLSDRLASGDDSAVAAVQRLGLNINDLLKAGPKEAFIQLGDAAGRIADPMEKNAIAADLFGAKLSKNLIPMLGNLRTEMEAVPKDALISDAQIEAADKFGDAWDRATIRFKASIFSIIEAFNTFNAVPPIDIEASVERLKSAGVTAGPIFDMLAKHRAKEAAETKNAMAAAYDYAASLGVVAGYAQGSAEVEKIHAAMLAFAAAAAEKAATALKAYNAIVKEVTATHDTFAETVDTIDGQIVEGIRYYLERGISVEKLATMYDLLTTQVQAVSEQMKAEAAATKEATAAAEAAFKAFVAEVTALNDLAAALRRVEHGNDQMNVDLTKIGEHVDVLPPKVKEATSAFSDLAQAFAQLAQISGDSFGRIVQDIGKVIGAINVATTGMDAWIKVQKADSGASSTEKWVALANAASGYYAAIMLIVDALNRGFGLEDSKTMIANNSARMHGVADFIAAQGGVDEILRKTNLTAQQLQESIRTALNARTPEAFAAAFKLVTDEIDRADKAAARFANIQSMASSRFGPSRADLQQAAVDAKDVLDYMTSVSLDAQGQLLANSQFTQDQLNKAYFAWQKSMADTGDAAAAAWVKAHEAVTAGADAANKAVKKLQTQRDDLAKSIENEAPEEVMGVLETQVRAQIAAIDAQIAASSGAAETAAENAARIIGATTNDTAAAIDTMVTETADKTGKAMSGAAVVVSDAFKVAADQIAVDIGEGTAGVMQVTADGIKIVMGDAAFFTAEEFKNAGQAARRSFQKVEEGAGELAQEIDAIFSGLSYEIPVTFRVDTSGLDAMPGVPTMPVVPMASGGYGHATEPMLFSTRGNEDFAFSGEGRRFASAGHGQAVTEIHEHHIYLDGREVVPSFITAIQRDDRGVATIIKRKIRG